MDGSNRSPVAVGGTPRGLAVAPTDIVDLIAPTSNDSTPTFTWSFDVPLENVEEVNLFVSTFAEGEGLLPWDEVVDLDEVNLAPELSQAEELALLSDPWQSFNDFNPGRILTATWKKETNTWYWYDGETPIVQVEGNEENTSTRLTLPDELALTAGQIGSCQKSFGQVSSSQVSFSEICTSQISMTQVSSSQISPTQISHSKNTINQISSNHCCSTQVSFRQINTVEISPTQDNIAQINFTQHSSGSSITKKTDASEISFSSSIAFEKISTSDIHDIAIKLLNNINSSATNIWSDLLQSETSLDINFQITDLPTGQLAEAQITDFDPSGNPIGGTILIDDDANGIGWYIDPNPEDNSEYAYTLADWAYQATPDSEAYGKYDLLTTILHETAHLFGFIDGFWAFDKRIQTIDGTRYLIGEDFSATLDGEHLDKNAHPYDLLNTHLAPGMRKLPSDLDVKILQLLLAEESGVRSQESGVLIQAPLTSAPLVGIVNSDFSIDDPNNPLFGWNTRGKTQILNQQAVLSENSPLQSKFSQTFTIPEHAKTLQFTLINSQLGTDFLPDAVEVALLDANTNISLVDTINGLTNTDAFINLQDDGTAYFGDNVSIPGAQSSGTPINPNTPRTIQLDISHLTPGQVATLSFDLLGLGAKDAEVTIDNIIILTDDSITPVANNDTASTTSTQPITINVINNDSDTDGSIDYI